MGQLTVDNLNLRTNIILNFIVTLAAVFIAVMVALALNTGARYPTADAASRNSSNLVSGVSPAATQLGSACTDGSNQSATSGDSGIGHVLSSVLQTSHPSHSATPMTSLTKTIINTDSPDDDANTTTTNNTTTSVAASQNNTSNTNILSNNNTGVLSGTASGNTVTVPILSESANNNTLTNTIPILDNNDSNTLSLDLISEIL